MIFDSLENAALYEGVNPGFPAAFAFLRQAVKELPAVGRHEINGSDVFANVMECDTAPAETRGWEAHRKYIDIQYIARGEEVIGYTDIATLEAPTDYDPDRDVLLADRAAHRGECDITPGSFGIFFPQDAHQPCCSAKESTHNYKIVVKVRV